MSRRSFITSLPAFLLCTSLGKVAFAQTASTPIPKVPQPKADQEGNPAIPWHETTPMPGSGDARLCRVFISLTCPYCAQYHEALWSWSRSLPAGWGAEFIPVLVQGQDSFIQAKAIAAASKADPSKLGEFLRSAYYALQQQKLPTAQESTWKGIVSASGYDMEVYSAAWRALPSDYDLVNPIVEAQSHYGISVTPTVVVGGTYLVTPDDTHGNQALFMQLLNALVSKAVGVV